MRSHVTMVTVIAAASMLAATHVAEAQRPERLEGPVIESFGGVADVSTVGEVAVQLPTDQDFKVIFELSESTPSPDRPNPGLEVVARYLNLHVRAGVPRDRIKVAVVIHGGAVGQVLSNEAYREEHGMDNPTLPRLQALADAGVDLYLCGQSAGFRGLTMDKVGAPVKLSLSAMTMETILQNDGYRVISHDWPRLAR